MAEAGVFGPDERVELLDGEIIPMLPPGTFHSGSINLFTRLFERAGRERWITCIQNPLSLNKRSVPLPDVMLLRPREDFYREVQPGPADVFLLVEVSDSSLAMDRQRKLPLYAAEGIAEFWILNVPERVVEVYREPAGRRYRVQMKVQAGETLAPLAFPDAMIDTAALLQAAK